MFPSRKKKKKKTTNQDVMSLRFVEALGKINTKKEGRPRAFYFLQQWSMFFPILSIYGEGEDGRNRARD